MRRSDPRRGVVLVTVLWTISLLSALVMAASVTFRGFAGVMAVERDRVQGEALLTAGLETAASIIDTLGDLPLTEVETNVTLGTGALRARLNDEGGRIDIGKAPVEVLAAMLRSVGAPLAAADDVAQQIVERRDPRRAPRPNATRRPPSAVTRTAGTGQPFADVGELQSIPGMAPDWMAAIAPLTTVFGTETVNPLTAPPRVIAALPGMDKERVDAFLRSRRSFPTDADRLARIAGTAQQYLAVKPPRGASIDLTAQLASGYAVGARAVIVVLPQDSQPYRVLVWLPVPSARLM
jgi:general secretion pathway protein K